MFDLIDFTDLIPTWPNGYDAWDGVTTLLIIALLKGVRASIMERRSTYIDRFGWSIIWWDRTFAIAALAAVVWSLYPSLFFDFWSPRAANVILKIVSIWQLVEVLRAPKPRIEAATAGTPTDLNGLNVYATEEGDSGRSWYGREEDVRTDAERPDEPPLVERRHHYRRLEDRLLRGLGE